MTSSIDMRPRISLLSNPFFQIGASSRDSKERILELADEASLRLDDAVCQQARAELTNARMRLASEISWLPGVAPRKALELATRVESDPASVSVLRGLPILAHCNLLAAAFEALGDDCETSGLESMVLQLAELLEEISDLEVAREINEDRVAAGFPEVRVLAHVHEQMAARRRQYRKSVQGAISRLDTDDLIRLMTDVVTNSRSPDTGHAPAFIDELVDGYALETKDFLQREESNLVELVAAGRDKAGTPNAALDKVIEYIESVVRNWCKVAKPIALSLSSRGMNFDDGIRVAHCVRNFAIDLFNVHGHLEQASRLTSLLKAEFGDLPEFLERVNEDEAALVEFAESRRNDEALSPLVDLSKVIRDAIEHAPDSGIKQAERMLDTGKEMLKTSGLERGSPSYAEGLDIIAMTVMICSIAYGNKSANWRSCVTLLLQAEEMASNVELLQRIRENLAIARENNNVFADIKPIKSAPTLRTLNGIGFGLYGKTDRMPSNGSHMATYYFLFLFFPVFPIARYRVIPTPGGYRFIGKGTLRRFDLAHMAMSAILLLAILSVF